MKTLSHQFVEFMPESLEDGVLYISLRFCLVTHKCCCGCGEEVVLKLSPKDWNLTFDGETISISPSIGNWSLKCQSHYWIRNSRVKWAPSWPDQKAQSEHQKSHPRTKGGFWSRLWGKRRDQ
jgi:hypothetical protein